MSRCGIMAPACLAGILALAVAASSRANAGEESASSAITDAGIASAWRSLRAIDCARCHGKHYEGLAAPSIVNYARTQSRDMFVRAVLDGNAPRGMPGYRGIAVIAERIDDIYQYFLGRADGSISAEARPRSP
jgi:cytochrome c55X